ncbi:glycoside hydrolase family 15 protein [soil metagenome]
MALIEDYGLIGDMRTAALVSREGSIDWLCVPRFDSDAVFAALLGDESNGRWMLAPAGEVVSSSRRYRDGTLVLESTYETASGKVRVTDCMAAQAPGPTIVRLVEGLAGTVEMGMELAIRFGYGLTVPWVRSSDEGISAVAGPDALYLRTEAPLEGADMKTVSRFEVSEGEVVPFTLTWHPSHMGQPDAIDGDWAVQNTERRWAEWSTACDYGGEWRPQVVRSLITLKALTFKETGAICAAPTTSLPEAIGGERNWDYRYCWLRDAALSIDALMLGGYPEEALSFGAWLQRATASHPSQAQILYGLGGERRLSEETLDWLPGYEGSTPVRIGNAASEQFQLDVFGELLDAADRFRSLSGRIDPLGWPRQLAALEHLEEVWREPDEGIWEVRGPRRHFTHSKVMVWVAFDRIVKAAEKFDVECDTDRLRAIRDEVHSDITANAFDAERNTFTQYYGSEELDAATLLIPAMGFLPPDDARVIGTIDAVRSELTTEDGFVLRYSTDPGSHDVDGLSGREGAFLPCSFWLADALAMAGRRDDAVELFERLLGLCNDLGLISEEYDPVTNRLIGNFPQAFTHLALINTASVLGGFKLLPRTSATQTG